MRFFLLVLGAMLLGAAPAFAQAIVAAPGPMTLNLNDIIIAVIGVVGSTILTLGTYFINKNISDANARAAFNAQLAASVGALQQAAKGVVTVLNPGVPVPGVSLPNQPAAQFMLLHASSEMKQLGIDGPMLDSHITAAIGSKEVEANIALAAKNGAVLAPLVVLHPQTLPASPPSPLLGLVPSPAT